jgi:hypothetical protein
MDGSNNHVKFSSAAYFSTPVWTAEVPQFLNKMLRLSDGYLKKTQKKIMKKAIQERDKTLGVKLEDFGLSNHSESFNNDLKAKDFVDFCGQRSYEFLDWCGFNISNHSLHFTECWVQEFSKKGAGHHDTHTHWNQHVSGFYFLKCSNKTSMPVLHDPRPGAQMIRLPQKDGSKITFANEAIHYNVKPGMMILIPGYTPHQYPVDMGIEPFRFIHWNIQAVPSAISNETSMRKKDDDQRIKS